MRRTVRSGRYAAALGWVLAGVALLAGVASAHRLDATAFAAPIPLPALYAGAAATVAVTAVWLGWGSPGAARRIHEPSAGHADGPADSDADGPADSDADGRGGSEIVAAGVRLPSVWTRRIAVGARILVLALFVAALAHGLVGPAAPAENLATVVVWPLLLKGVAIVAVIAGSPWRAISPWETLYDALVAVEGERIAVLGAYPDRLGTWPAVVGFVVGVGVFENLTVATRSPELTVAVAGGYAAAMLLGGVAFGREWFARADALAVLFSLLGRVSVLRVERTADGGRRGRDTPSRVSFGPPWTGCLAPVADDGAVVFVVAAVYTVSFDGFTATATFESLRLAVADAVGLATAGIALYLAGLCLFVASYLAAAAMASRLAGGLDAAGFDVGTTALDGPASARAFAGSVVPIAAAYEVAHNYPYVAANLGQVVGIVRGLLPGAAVEPIAVLAWLPVAAFWASQVLLVVGGHVVGVVAAHGVASRRTASAADARRSHAPLVVVMVGYTVLSLWVISQPLAS